MVKDGGEERPVTRRECDLKHQEVANVKDWLSKVDNRLWLLIVGLLLNALGTVTTLVILLVQKA